MSSRLPEHWLLRTDRDYPAERIQLSASNWQPERYPVAISRPRTAEQVRADVLTAAERGLGIAVRSGGHSTSGAYLSDTAVTLDLGGLRDVSLDAASGTAWIGPGLTALGAARALDAAGLFFPLGHSPTVGVGGFLLAGGNGWNTPVWGHGSDRILAAEVVRADGRLLTIDAATEPELFALLRGAGPAFPAVVTAFQVALACEQPQIRRVLLTVDGANPSQLGRRLDEVIDQLPPQVETTLFWHPARAPGERPTAMVAATSFGQDETDDPLTALHTADLPVLSATDAAPGPSMLRLIDPLPRHPGEAVFSHHTWAEAGYAEVLPLLPVWEDRLSPCSCVLLTTSARRSGTGVAEMPAAPDGLYRPAGTMSISAYAHWDPATLPPEIGISWTRQVISRLQPWSTGRYVGEADLTDASTSAQECFGNDGAARLAAGRARFDPDHLLHTPFRSPSHHL
ncbi:FAD-binding oxidoreductase [Ruania zhangjianzhongii]|uniref:FAD-binding oxidoreductase n=1 Tax=Ruania zhangjianzhongii TaxID=2603206 RepID=UPI0011C96425|nr:FAD-dependent oxidoreductase [Ruania zhangjianzhongii]